MLNIQITHRLFARQLHHVNRSRRRVELACIEHFLFANFLFCFPKIYLQCNWWSILSLWISNLSLNTSWVVVWSRIPYFTYYIINPIQIWMIKMKKTIMFLAYNDTHTLIKNLYENLCFRALVVYCKWNTCTNDDFLNSLCKMNVK